MSRARVPGATRGHLVLVAPGYRAPALPRRPRPDRIVIDSGLVHRECFAVPPTTSLVLVWELVSAFGRIEEALFYEQRDIDTRLWGVQGNRLRMPYPERHAAALTAERRVASGCLVVRAGPVGGSTYGAYALLRDLVSVRVDGLRVRNVSQEGLLGREDVRELGPMNAPRRGR
jgi:hypothetical protein